MTNQGAQTIALLSPLAVSKDRKHFVLEGGESLCFGRNGSYTRAIDFAKHSLFQRRHKYNLPSPMEVTNRELLRRIACLTELGLFLACALDPRLGFSRPVAIIDGLVYDPITQVDGLVYPVPVQDATKILRLIFTHSVTQLNPPKKLRCHR